MDKEWCKSQLEKVERSCSIFRFIPSEIGKTVYCDTDQPKEVPDSKEQIKRRRMIVIPICICLLVVLWWLLYTHYIWASIISIIVLLVMFVKSDGSFSGTDYFVGDEGFAIVNFSKNRENVTDKNVILFRDLEFLFTSQTVIKQNFVYMRTEYSFALYSHVDDSNSYKVVFSRNGSYNDKNPKDLDRPDGMEQDYPFLKAIERQWTSFFFKQHVNDPLIMFGLYNKETIYSDYIKMSLDYIEIEGVKYTRDNWKRIYFSNGELVIEHENHSSKLFGLIEKGNISRIPLSNLGNRQAFLLLVEKFFGT